MKEPEIAHFTESDLEEIVEKGGERCLAAVALSKLRQALADGRKPICVGSGGEIYVLDVRELLRGAGR